MKGPGLRNDLEIRRTFLCPRCGRTVLKLGDVVSLACFCSDPPVWMQIQPDPKKRAFKFDKIEVPLTEEDLIVRDRPRRMPAPPPEGAPEVVNDRRNARPKRPKPERRSFESFQEDLNATADSESVEVVNGTPRNDVEASAVVPDVTAAAPDTVANAAPPVARNEEFGEGL